MGIQSTLIGAVVGTGAAVSGVKKTIKKRESPSSIAAKKAQASLAEHREAKKSSYFVAPKLSDVSNITKVQKGE